VYIFYLSELSGFLSFFPSRVRLQGVVRGFPIWAATLGVVRERKHREDGCEKGGRAREGAKESENVRCRFIDYS